jgi:hypothetical protein
MKSIELHWLSKRDKWLVLPELRFVKGGYGGTTCYIDPVDYAYECSWGETMLAKNGLIVINTTDWVDTEEVKAAIAHEWRHHWQTHSGVKCQDSSSDMYSTLDFNNWEHAVKKYYKIPHERDALEFSCQLTKSETQHYALSLLK